jgi:hypothetical protein
VEGTGHASFFILFTLVTIAVIRTENGVKAHDKSTWLLCRYDELCVQESAGIMTYPLEC